VINSLERRGFNPDLSELLIREQISGKKFLQDHQRMSTLKDILTQKGYNVNELIWNEDRDVYEMMVTLGAEQPNSPGTTDFSGFESKAVKIGRGLVFSRNFQLGLITGKRLQKYDKPPFSVVSNKGDNKAIVIEDKKKLLLFLIEAGKKGLGVQRYKGLGEMNPDQLWETTMNPEKRTFLKVKIEDMFESDEIFTILMGDEVEPRREFIQKNALEVNMLDI